MLLCSSCLEDMLINERLTSKLSLSLLKWALKRSCYLLLLQFPPYRVEYFHTGGVVSYEGTVTRAGKRYSTSLRPEAFLKHNVGDHTGTIDEVDQQVTMTWVQPRVLDMGQVYTTVLLLLHITTGFTPASSPLFFNFVLCTHLPLSSINLHAFSWGR